MAHETWCRVKKTQDGTAINSDAKHDQDDSRAPALLLSHPVPFAIITVIIVTTNIHALCHLV